jgi:TrmH family RNA methyltransferase
MITSRANPKIKQLIQLNKAVVRKENQRTIIEGFREISRALQSGWKLEELYVVEKLADQKLPQLMKSLNKECQLEFVNEHVFSHIAYREGSDGMLAVAKIPDVRLEQLKISDKALIIILEGVEKPGNLGAIMRTADAAAADAVLVCEPTTDVYNPNAIRSSLGCIFSCPVVATDSISVYNWLKSNNIKIFATSLEASIDYLDCNYNQASAIVMGTEATGLSDFWTKQSDQNIKITMRGIADSLNVSVATAVVVFEAIRQRR